MTGISNTPVPPYFSVAFTSTLVAEAKGYDLEAEKMVRLASQQEGFLGIESVRDASGFGITISYWTSLKAIGIWKQQADHLLAQQRGKSDWYSEYKVRICKVEREYSDQ